VSAEDLVTFTQKSLGNTSNLTMRLGTAPLWLAMLGISTVYGKSPPFLRPRDYESRDYYALHLTRDVSPEHVARQLGLVHEGPIGELDDHHLFSTPTSKDDVVSAHLEDLRRRKRAKRSSEWDLSDAVLLAEKQKLKKLVKRIPPSRRQGPPPAIEAGTSDSPGTVKLESIVKALDIKDPIFNLQWHLVRLLCLWMLGVC
jgi:kexin